VPLVLFLLPVAVSVVLLIATVRLNVKAKPGCEGCEYGALVAKHGGPCPWCLYDNKGGTQ
jgi:hypothetical protein